MSEEQFEDEVDSFEEINISEVLQLVLTMQSELGIMSDILSDVLKTGEFDKVEMLKALQSINDLSLEAIEIMAEVTNQEDEPFNPLPSDGTPEDIN